MYQEQSRSMFLNHTALCLKGLNLSQSSATLLMSIQNIFYGPCQRLLKGAPALLGFKHSLVTTVVKGLRFTSCFKALYGCDTCSQGKGFSPGTPVSPHFPHTSYSEITSMWKRLPTKPVN